MLKSTYMGLISILSSMIIFAGCDESKKDNDANTMLLILLMSNKGSITFYDSGIQQTWTTAEGFTVLGGLINWVGTFVKDNDNGIIIGLPSGAGSGDHYTQATSDWGFSYFKNGIEYSMDILHTFNFYIDTMADGKIAAHFSGSLYNGGTPVTIDGIVTGDIEMP